MSLTHVAFYPSDWLAGTRGLSAEETGVYITLVARMYELAGPIPLDDHRLARLCGCSRARFRKALDVLLDEGKVVLVDGDLFNDRVDRELRATTEKSVKARAAAEARWRKKRPKNNAGAVRSQCDGNAGPAPDDPVLRRASGLAPRVMEAAGIDVSASRSPARWLGSEARDLISMWIRETALSDDQILETVKETAHAKHDGPAGSLRYFTPAIQRRAERLRQGLPPERGSGGRAGVDDAIALAADRIFDKFGPA